MNADALGMIETRGLIGAIEAADAMVKAANVTITDRQEVGDGLVAVVISGEVGVGGSWSSVQSVAPSGFLTCMKTR